MITPNKFMRLEDSTLKISAEILGIIIKKQNKKIKYSKLYKSFFEKYKENTDYFFHRAWCRSCWLSSPQESMR